MHVGVFFLFWIVVPMLVSGTLLVLHPHWCGSKRRIVAVAVAYLVVNVAGQLYITLQFWIPHDDSIRSPALVVAGVLVLRIIDLAPGLGKQFFRCWRGVKTE